MPERLQKILAAHGVASRREAESMIESGRVSLNGAPARLGQSADPVRDRIMVDGQPIVRAPKKVYIMLNKPRGYVTTTSDERGRRVVTGLMPGHKVYPVGRLDINSEGLLIMTNDGELANKLMHPSHRVDKQYLVWVRGPVAEALPLLVRPMTVEGVHYQGARARVMNSDGEGGLLSMTIAEGKNKQVRRMCAYAGLSVTRLKRVSIGRLELGELAPGEWRYLRPEEVRRLMV